MILITGGLGFIGSHVTRALLDLGEKCVLAQRRRTWSAPLFEDEIGSTVLVETVDVADRQRLMRLGDRYEITGILHLAGAYFRDALPDARENVNAWLNVLEAAKCWGSARVGFASTIGVYTADGHGPQTEDAHVDVAPASPIASSKLANEVVASHLAPSLGIEVYAARIGAIWGPLGRVQSPFFATPQLIHAAINGLTPDFGTLPGSLAPRPDDAVDLMYVRDCGRALATLQTAPELRHSVYNVSGGRAVPYSELVDAIHRVVPSAKLALNDNPRAQPAPPAFWLDTGRLESDTAYRPRFTLADAVADYIAWLRAGHER